MGLERRGRVRWSCFAEQLDDRMTSIDTTNKPFMIEKRQVYEAYKAVKSNKGVAGVDGQTIEQFEADLGGNLYKIWNRMSSGSYFPPPVRAVTIPKKSGGERILGVPTVGDRIAQMVVKQLIEPDLDPIFLPNSYGYRPRKSALDAVGVTRERCWKYDWVLEFDIKGLFDNLPHELLLRAVQKHVKCKWALLYIERWLTAPMEKEGLLIERTRGTPQGGVISPILSNLFLHYAFDLWMTRTHPGLPWCRYADDGLVHCRSEQEAEALKAELQARLAECGLEMHPTKTKIVYCKDGKRKGRRPVGGSTVADITRSQGLVKSTGYDATSAYLQRVVADATSSGVRNLIKGNKCACEGKTVAGVGTIGCRRPRIERLLHCPRRG